MRKIAIVFPDTHLAFSPTTLNLSSSLSKYFDVKIISFHQSSYKPLDWNNVIYLRPSKKVNRILQIIFKYLMRVKEYEKRCLYVNRIMLSFHLIFNKYHHLIAVDLKALWLVQAVRKKNIHLLSLELTESTTSYRASTKLSNLKSIIIQSSERLAFLTGNQYSGKTFYIQNAPSCISNIKIQNKSNQYNLIYCGTALRQFGIFRYLDFLISYPDFTLTIQGTVHGDVLTIIKTKYASLIQERRLIINQNYLEITELINYVSNFRMGFCFYDLEYPEMNNFNYLTAPSGKMFTYFAAGVPVLANSISGLDIVTDFNAGTQIKSLSPVDIKNGIDKVELNYHDYRDNCFKAAKHFDFNTNVHPFINYLME